MGGAYWSFKNEITKKMASDIIGYQVDGYYAYYDDDKFYYWTLWIGNKDNRISFSEIPDPEKILLIIASDVVFTDYTRLKSDPVKFLQYLVGSLLTRIKEIREENFVSNYNKVPCNRKK